MGRRDIHVSWLDALKGAVEIPASTSVRIIVRRLPVSIFEIPHTESFFAREGSVLLPAGGVPTLAAVLERVDEWADHAVAIYGHGGRSRGASLLSHARGESIRRWIQADAWPQHAHQVHRRSELRILLAWADEQTQCGCTPGVGVSDVEALGRFRAHVGGPPNAPAATVEDFEAFETLLNRAVAARCDLGIAEVERRNERLGPALRVTACGDVWMREEPAMGGPTVAGPRHDVAFLPTLLELDHDAEQVPGQAMFAEPNFRRVSITVEADPPTVVPGDDEDDPTPTPPSSPSVTITSLSPSPFWPPLGPLTVEFAIGAHAPASATLEVYDQSGDPSPIHLEAIPNAKLEPSSTQTMEWNGFGSLVGALASVSNSPYHVRIGYQGEGDQATDIHSVDVVQSAQDVPKLATLRIGVVPHALESSQAGWGDQDRFHLFNADGSVDEARYLSEAQIAEDGDFELEFRDVPTASPFTLHHYVDNDFWVVFSEMSYQDLAQIESSSPPPPPQWPQEPSDETIDLGVAIEFPTDGGAHRMTDPFELEALL